YVPVHEFEFAKKLKTSYTAVVEMLSGLQKLQLASYLPKTDAPQLEFLQPRVDYKNLYVDTGFIAERKKVKEGQVKAMYAYLDTTAAVRITCHSYFGWRDYRPCGASTHSFVRKHRAKTTQSLTKNGKNALMGGKNNFKQLVDALT